MNRFIKPLYDREPDGEIYELVDADLSLIPIKSGVYIIKSHDQEFVYPRGTSPIIYIGMSHNLRERLRIHQNNTIEVKNTPKKERHLGWRYSRYQYFVAFGAEVYWYTTRGLQDQKNLEAKLIENFYDKYLAIPIGNGAISFYK